jgi:hypothetical protein
MYAYPFQGRAAPLLLVLIFGLSAVSCSCGNGQGDIATGPVLYIQPIHNTTYVRGEVALHHSWYEWEDDEPRISSAVLESLVIIGPGGDVVPLDDLDPELRVRPIGDFEWDEKDRVIFHGIHDWPGWYTFRSAQRDPAILYHSHSVGRGAWQDVDDAYEIDLLVGVSEPGLAELTAGRIENNEGYEDHLNIRLTYSEHVRLDQPIAESITLFDVDGNVLECESLPWRLPDGGTEDKLESDWFNLRCDLDTPMPAAIRVDRPPRGETGVEAVFPPPGEILEIDFVTDVPGRSPHWVPRLRSYSDGLESGAHELAPAEPASQTAPVGGCGAAVASRDGAGGLAVTLLAFAGWVGWRRRNP